MAVFVLTAKSEGLSDCLKDISKYNARCRLAVENALRKGTKQVAKGARRRVPVESGGLKKSITSSFKTTTLVGYARAKKPHAHLIEFGAKGTVARPKKRSVMTFHRNKWKNYTGNKTILNFEKVNIPTRRARPFMIPAFKENESKIVADVKKGLQNA